MRYLAVLLLAGCASVTPIDTSRAPPADWPKMYEVVERISQSEVLRTCSSTMPGYSLKACAMLSFSSGTCIIKVVEDAGSAESALINHERMHCRGYDHPGSTQTRDAWERYKTRAAR